MAGKPKHDSIMQTIATADSIATIEQEYAAAERDFSKAAHDVLRFQQEHREAASIMLINGKAYNRVNGAALNPQLQLLCHVRELARMKRNELLSRRASALRDAGRIR